MTTRWADIANSNPFEKEVAAKAEATQEEIAAMADTFYIQASDGRMIPCTVDNGTRSVYPVRKV